MGTEHAGGWMSGNDEQRNYVINSYASFSIRVDLRGLTPINGIFKWAMNVLAVQQRTLREYVT